MAMSILEKVININNMFNYLFGERKKRSIVSAVIVVAALMILTQQTFIPTRASYWGSFQVKIAGPMGANIVGTTSFMPYTVPLSSPVTNISEMSAVLSAFQLAAFSDMLFRITQPIYNSVLQRAEFSLQVVSPSSFVFFRFFIVYCTQQSQDFFEINLNNVTTSNVNGAAGTTRSEWLTSTTRLSFTGVDTYKVEPVLSSIMLYNNNLEMYFKLWSSSVSGTTLNVKITTSNSVTEILVTTFILKTNLLPAEYIFYYDTSIPILQTVGEIANFCSTTMFGIPANNGYRSGTYNYFNENCSLAVSYLDDENTGVLRRLNYDVTSGAGFSSCSNSAQSAPNGTTMTIQLSAFCSYYAKCTNASEFYDPATTNITGNCKPCSTHDPHCTECNVTDCFTCSTGYYPRNNPTVACLVCSQTNCTSCITATTCGACTNTSYLLNETCWPCTNISNCEYCSSNTFCTGCVSGYGPDPYGICFTCGVMIPQCQLCQNYYTCSQCASDYFLAPGGSSCTSCAYNITNCNSCVNSYNCTGCLSGYYLQSITKCVSCALSVSNCNGCLGNGSCTSCSLGYYLANSTACILCTIPGCSNCTGNSTCVNCLQGYYLNVNLCSVCPDPNCINCTSAALCNECSSDYMLDANNITCSCKSGWPITNVCINVTACITAVKVGNVSTCVFCNSLNNFIVSGTTCVCKTGYKQKNDNCQNVCGDGITISANEQCDDGNNYDGDGCSSTCQLESGYQCGYDGTVYKCVLTANFTLNLEYILKSQSQNSGTYFLSISPAVQNLQLLNYTKLSTFTVSISPTYYTVRSIGYSSGFITVTVDFTKDIQGLNAVLNLNFDVSYFNTTNITYSMVSTGTNQPLIISSYVTHLQYLKIIAYVILGLAAVILLLSVAFDKMIGIETVNVIQIIVFSKLLYVQNDILFSGGIASLKYIQGYNEINKNQAHVNQVPLTYRRLQFQSDFILNFQTGLMMMVLSLLILLSMEIYRWKVLREMKKYKKGSIDEFKLFEQKLSEKKRFLYERVFLTFACVNLFDCMASIRLQSRSLEGESHYTFFFLNLVAMLPSIIYIFAILTYEVLSVGKEHTWTSYFCSYSQYYVGYYMCYILLVTPILIGGQGFSGATGVLIMASMILVNLVILIVWRPYKLHFHNVAIIYNNSILLFVLAVSLVLLMGSRSESLELIWAYVVMSLVFVMECLAYVRLYLAAKAPPKENQRIARAGEGQEELKKEMDNIEKEYLNPRKRMKNPISKAQMEEDDLVKLRNRLKKEFQAKNTDEIPII